MASKNVKVRLIVAHTGIGKPGDECEMEAEKAAAHEAQGLLEIVRPPKKTPAKGAPEPPTDK